jgi:hypothetical protein
MEGPRKETNKFNQDSISPGLASSPESLKQEAGLLTIRQKISDQGSILREYGDQQLKLTTELPAVKNLWRSLTTLQRPNGLTLTCVDICILICYIQF